MVDAKITFVHERLWPALFAAKDHLTHGRLARLHEVHRPNGKHEIEEIPFPDWVPRQTLTAAKRLNEAEALKVLGISNI